MACRQRNTVSAGVCALPQPLIPGWSCTLNVCSYVAYEDFDSDELEFAAVFVLTLPVALVILSFW